MNKPITLMRQEFIENVADLVNESGLPLILVEPILRDLLEKIQASIRQQTELDKIAYEKYLKEQEEKENTQAEDAPK